MERIIEKFIEIEVPYEKIVERVVEKRVEVMSEPKIVERIVEVPVVIPAPEGVTRGVQTDPWEPEVTVIERERVVYREAPAKVVQVLPSVQVETRNANVGAGMLLERNEAGLTYVEEVVAGFAAWKSGRVSVGDIVVAVDARPVDGMNLADIRSLTIGAAGSAVTIEFLRNGEYFSLTLVRSQPDNIDEGNIRACSVISRDSLHVEQRSSTSSYSSSGYNYPASTTLPAQQAYSSTRSYSQYESRASTSTAQRVSRSGVAYSASEGPGPEVRGSYNAEPVRIVAAEPAYGGRTSASGYAPVEPQRGDSQWRSV